MEERRNHRVIVSRRGGPEVLMVVQEDLPEPEPGEVRVEVKASGISAYDAMGRSLTIPGNPSPPFTPGEDIVGTVDAVGDQVTNVDVGQRVAAWTFGRGGGYAEFVCAPAEHVVPVPSGVDDAEAVSVVVNFLTAHLYMHKTANVQSGERVLVHGAAGGLGTALLQLGELAGLEMYGTASRHNHHLVSSLGATPIDYKTEDFVEAIHRLTDGGVDVVFDPIGGARQLVRSSRSLRKGGRLIPLGSVATEKSGVMSIPLGLAAVLGLRLLPNGKQVHISPNMMKYPFEHNDWYRETLGELLDHVASDKLSPVVAERIPLLEAVRAHERLDRGGYAGKLVLTSSE